MYINIGIIDADLIGRKNHRFPNLACEKISSYWKQNKDACIELKLDYKNFDRYDHIYISKVFTDTPCPYTPDDENEKIHIGGSGFYFDKAPPLPYEIEHCMPDYSLYKYWIEEQLENGDKLYNYKNYLEYSLGFMTRGCFRKCDFCINKRYDKILLHSPLSEFYDPSRKKICLLDDNILGYKHWDKVFSELQKTNKPFKFTQGLDERTLTDEKCKMLALSKYDGNYTFAFDNAKDCDLIEEKLILLRKYTDTARIKFYVLVGFESCDLHDIEGIFKRISLLMKYGCVPYIMRYQAPSGSPINESRFKDVYTNIASWCNQTKIFCSMSFREYCVEKQKTVKNKDYKCTAMQALELIESEAPQIADRYFDLKFENWKSK